MSFVLKLENSKVLKNVIETLSDIIEENEIVVTPEEFFISAIDPGHVCLLKLSLERDLFEIYKCKKETRIGINLGDFDKVLKRSTAQDSLTLEYNEKEDRLKIKMQNENVGNRTRAFNLAIMDIEIEDVPIENLIEIDYPATWCINPAILLEAIKDAEIYADIINLKSIEGQGLEINATSPIGIGEMEYVLSKEELIDYKIEGTNIGTFPINFLKSVMKLNSITEKLEMGIRSENPLKLVFNIQGGGILNYFLAPQVELELEDKDENEEN